MKPLKQAYNYLYGNMTYTQKMLLKVSLTVCAGIQAGSMIGG